MKSITFVICILSIVFADITCSSGQVYAKVSKQSGSSYANEESYQIYGNGILLETSPTFANNELRVIEYCLTASTNSQYSVKMIDSYGDSWSSGSWLMIEGLYGNRVFKTFLADQREEEYTFSLYYGYYKNDAWKFSGSVSGSWTDYSFPDTTWTEVTLGGEVSAPAAGTQYFRKQFVGLPSMVAYEASFNFRFGIVAYINGVEIFRDNMAEGPVTSTTTAIGSYPTVEYHAIIRSGSEVANGQSVMAVEIHFLPSATQTSIDFNSYLSIMASNVAEETCFIYPYTTIISGNGNNPGNLFDFSRSTSFYTSTFPTEVIYTYSGAKPFINGFRIWPYSSQSSAPTGIVLQGGDSASGTTWTNVVTGSNMVFSASTYKTSLGYFNANLFNAYKLKVVSASATTSYIYEGQLVTCSTVMPTSIQYDAPSYTYYALYDSVHIAPIVAEFTGCSINPPAAAGLTFDAATCTLSGKAQTASTTQYTVTSTMNGQSFTGSFSLQIVSCTGTLAKVLRVYGSNAVYENYSIIDATTQSVVISVASNSGQTASTSVESIVCLTGTKYEIDVGSTTAYWYYNSFLYVNTILGDDEYETMIRAKFDNNNGLPTSYTFNAQYAIKPMESWNYKMGEVPANWYSSDTAGWTSGTAGTFPASSNQIQLYKKTFSIASTNNMAGVVISFKYQYGYIIYLNNHEVARKGFTGELSASTYATTSLTDLKWRSISLPMSTIGEGAAAMDYIIAGTNTIAIGLIAVGPAQTTASFDGAVRLMGEESSSRIFDASLSYSSISGSPTYILYHSYSYNMYYSTCADNYLQITFNNDRHEWISSVAVKLAYNQGDQQPRQFILKAKNAEDSEWTTLKTVTGLTWSLMAQRNRIWINNNKAYNQYRFENFATGSTSDCAWKVGLLDLISDSTTVTIPNLTYPASTSIFKDIEMAEIYPDSTLYTDFTVSPPLPNGVNLDANTGTISGTATAVSPAQTYTISAKKFTGATMTAQLSIAVEICTGGKSLITLVARSDSWPSESSYKLYQGKGMSGTVIASIDAFLVANNLNYGDFCLNHGIYTLELRDTLSDGWSNPAGYYLTVDVGAFKFEMGQVYTAIQPTSVTTMFSSYLPFQIEYDDWKVYKLTDSVSESWNTVNFDDSTWTTTKAAQIGTTEAMTVYIRRDVNIDDISNYYVLNVRMKYVGGVAAYFNGRLAARFNLEEEFDASTPSIAVHDSNKFSMFHVILNTSGGVSGKNVIAFEIHRPAEQSSAEPIVFDATGVFGVNDCSIAVDSVINVDGTEATTIGDLKNFFDLTPVTYGYQTNAVGTYLRWEVENLEGSKFNSFALQTVYSYTWGYSLYAREEDREEWTSIYENPSITAVARGRTRHAVPAGIASYNQFRWVVDVVSSSTQYVSAYIFEYCKPSGTTICPGVDDYPPVGEGEISPGNCQRGFRGYSYRECQGGTLGEVKYDKCVYRLPSYLRYRNQRITAVLNTETSVEAPFYRNIITRFYLAENTFLPEGLILDETTGVISGVATEESSIKEYTIYGENPAGVTYTTITLTVRKGECKAEGNFPKTTVGEVAEYECSVAGSYVGTQKRACILGARDGEWQKIRGTCMPVSMIVILVIIVIIVVAVVGLFVMRATRKTKAVGGVKGKRSAKTTKTAPKKAANKSVKV